MKTPAFLCMALLLPFSVTAEPVNQMPNFQYDEMAAKLIGQGYRDLRVVDASRGLMSAYDEYGSEVMIVVDVANRQVVSTAFVHLADE